MLTEAIKKRGRPKKVIPESIMPEIEPAQKKTRQKSTKAASLPPEKVAEKRAPSNASQDEPLIVSAGGQKKARNTQSAVIAMKTTSSSLPPTQREPIPEPIAPSSNASVTASLAKVTITNSKILNQVRALSSKAPSPAKISTTPKPQGNNTASSPAAGQNTRPPSRPKVASSAVPKPPLNPISLNPRPESPASSGQSVSDTSIQPPAKSLPSTTQPQLKRSPKAIPISAINSSIVSQISSRAGARPAHSSSELPPNYKPVARKITMVMVAIPVFAVTSWVLYQRLVLGEDQKHLVRSGVTTVKEGKSTTKLSGDTSQEDVR